MIYQLFLLNIQTVRRTEIHTHRGALINSVDFFLNFVVLNERKMSVVLKRYPEAA